MSDPRLLDRNWRINNLYWIKNKNQQLVKFKLNEAQLDFDKNKWTRNIILKSRQLGFTTFETVDMLDDVSFNRNFDALFIAQDLDTAKDIFSNKVDLAWDNFILNSFYKVNTESARQLKLDFGDKTVSSITVDSSGRSGTYRRVHCSEFAIVCKKFPEKAREIIEGTIPAVPIDGRIDFESTAEEAVGHFYNMFWEAWERGDPTIPTQFKAHFYNWTWDKAEIRKVTPEQIKSFLESKDFPLFVEYKERHNLSDPEITYYYFKWLSLNKNWHSLHKEYPTTAFEAFSSAGNKLFDENKLSQFKTLQGVQENEWTYFHKPIIGHQYVWGADVGEGIGKDHSTVTIMDVTLLKPTVVATFKNNMIAPDIFAFEIKNGASKYGMAFGAVERNNHGHTTISKLREIYPELLIYKDDKDRFGWETNLVSKPKMFYDFNTAVNNELIDIPSKPLISEMRRYDKEDLRSKKYGDEVTEHFDLVTSAVIAFQMRTEYGPDESGITQAFPSDD